MKIIFPLLAVLFLLSACGGSPSRVLLENHAADVKSANSFGICKGYGCKYYLKTGLSPEEWQTVRDIFSPPPTTAIEERIRIAQAISKMEQLVGPKTDTDQDAAGAQIINFSTGGQMDCIDEAFNSTTYLYLMRKDGLIKFHSVGAPLRRGYLFDGWPHNTATIHVLAQERAIGNAGHFVVDSWFHVNGALPDIVPASVWSDGWGPEKK